MTMSTTPLRQFLRTNRREIIARTLALAAEPTGPDEVKLRKTIPSLLTQLELAVDAALPPEREAREGVVDRAQLDGHDQRRGRLTLGEVVAEYGSVRRVIAELAIEQDVSLCPIELLGLHQGLDDAIATAVTSNARENDRALAAERSNLVRKLGHDIRNQLGVALLSFDLIARGDVTATGSTAVMHARSLRSLRDLLERSLAELRLDPRSAREEGVDVVTRRREEVPRPELAVEPSPARPAAGEEDSEPKSRRRVRSC